MCAISYPKDQPGLDLFLQLSGKFSVSLGYEEEKKCMYCFKSFLSKSDESPPTHWQCSLYQLLSSNHKLLGQHLSESNFAEFLKINTWKVTTVNTTKPQYTSFGSTHVILLYQSELFTGVICSHSSGKESCPEEISEFNVITFSSEFWEGKQTLETVWTREHIGTEAVISKRWSGIAFLPHQLCVNFAIHFTS